MIFRDLGWFEDLLEILNRVLEDSIDTFATEKRARDRPQYGRNYGKKKEKTQVEELLERTDELSKTTIAIMRYQNDDAYRYLHDRISELFAESLKSDLSLMESDEIEKISYASKFCPSIDSAYDKATLICENIAKKIFPRCGYAEYRDLKEADYTCRVRDRLQEHVLIPLRKAIGSQKMKKSSMETGKALIALETYRKIFRPEGDNVSNLGLFKHYMNMIYIMSPKESNDMLDFGDGIKLPTQIIASLLNKESTAELEWRRLVQEFSSQGKLLNCVAVCDISPSMTGTFKETACVSMGLLISELSGKPWKGRVFSFNEFPNLYNVEGDNLRSKCEFMRQIECTEKLSFASIYDQLLQIAITEKLSKTKIPRMIFVFTYKDFIVFWNLKDPIAEPVVFGCPVKNQHGGMIVTGFSNVLLKLFFNGLKDSRTYAAAAAQFRGYYDFDIVSVLKYVPKLEDLMECAISREEFKDLLLFD
ncbi:hypothetical protein ACLB2K_012178 [Fragaria x ananassa]